MAEALGAGVAIATAVLTLGQFLQQQAKKKLDNDDSSIRVWVSDVRDLAYECEDVIDTFLLKLSCMREPQPGCIGTMSLCFVAYTAKFPSTYELGCQIEKLMTKVNDISSRRQRYRLDATDVSSTSDSREKKLMQLRRSAPYANNEHMVGLGETISLLKGKLTNGGSGRFVISILGMGGLGKTTLARKLYNSLRQKYFESYSWVCVSQDYKTLDILLQLIKSMANPTKEVLDSMTTEASREEYLRTWLTGRRFLVVIDDVWEREAWESLERAFPDINKNSRVIITTRNQRVADLKTAYVHKLRYLDDDESWKLFRKKAFPDDNEMICPPDLKGLGKEMVTKCSGLPLAIITLGGLLSTKSPFLSEWEMVRDNLWKELEKDNSVHINAVLQLSYKDLPQNLKPCFLYVGMFPEDCEIPISQLICKWVAEGFIGQEEEGSPEDTAKSYFNELVGRSLIQKEAEDWIGYTCRVHDLLRDMAIRKAKEMCFSLYHDGKTTSKLSKALPHRRLTYMACDKIPSSYINPSLRTFYQVSWDSHPNQQWNTAPEKMFQSLFECFSLLRVLDIQVNVYGTSKIEVLKIPGEIGKLVHLRYLGLGLPLVTKGEFPETISNLKALETLSVRSITPVTLPKTVVKLKNLRHLMARFDSTGDWIGKLTGLETLDEVSYDQWCDIDTTCLVNLRYVFITDVDPQDEANPTKFYDKFKSLTMLQTLALHSSGVDWFSALEIFKRCPSITHFYSDGMNYNQSVGLHEFAVNLQVLEMLSIKHDPIPSIKKLPKLRALRIVMFDVIWGTNRQLICSDGGFTQLRTLKIEIYGDCEFVVEEGSLPSLTHLEIDKPDRLKAPDSLKHLIIKTS